MWYISVKVRDQVVDKEYGLPESMFEEIGDGILVIGSDNGGKWEMK